MSLIAMDSYDHLPQIQEMSLVIYCILVSYYILVSYCILASAYGLKAISDWFSQEEFICHHKNIQEKLTGWHS